MGTKYSTVQLFYFPNAIGPNGSNLDSEMSHFAGVLLFKRNYSQVYRCLFHHVSLWDPGHHVMDVITLFGHHKNIKVSCTPYVNMEGSFLGNENTNK